MKTYTKNLLLIIICLYCTMSYAVKNSESNLEITSTKLTLNNENSSALFTGMVVIKFEDIELTTSQLTVFYIEKNNKRTIGKIVIPNKLTAIKKCDGTILLAEKGEYISEATKLTLTGNVRMKRNDDILATDKLVYFTNFKEISNAK